jgi:hypothetical protein
LRGGKSEQLSPKNNPPLVEKKSDKSLPSGRDSTW